MAAGRLHDMQEGMETAFHNVQLDEKSAREDCPDNVKDALLFKMKSGVSAVSTNANRVLRRSEEHTSNSSHDQNSYAVFCLKKKT